MELYKQTSYQAAKLFTENYSTSFSTSCRLFAKSLQPHIFAIYGLVRVADEVVDTYGGSNQMKQLDALEREVKSARMHGYSTNPLVHAFALTAEVHSIKNEIIAPFFESMRMDIGDCYTPERYEEYIYGSAEVVGLMCLRVFVDGDDERYAELEPGAKALGAAYQKVNFLRDIKADHELGRMYFPGVSYEKFDDTSKQAIEADISDDFEKARDYVGRLPVNARSAVKLSYEYYEGLLKEIKQHSAEELKQERIRVTDTKKLGLLVKARLKQIRESL